MVFGARTLLVAIAASVIPFSTAFIRSDHQWSKNETDCIERAAHRLSMRVDHFRGVYEHLNASKQAHDAATKDKKALSAKQLVESAHAGNATAQSEAFDIIIEVDLCLSGPLIIECFGNATLIQGLEPNYLRNYQKKLLLTGKDGPDYDLSDQVAAVFGHDTKKQKELLDFRAEVTLCVSLAGLDERCRSLIDSGLTKDDLRSVLRVSNGTFSDDKTVAHLAFPSDTAKQTKWNEIVDEC